MSVRLRLVEDLAKDLKKDKKAALTYLMNLGIRVIDGYYDAVRFEATIAEPQWLRAKRNEWTLSPRTGLGAVKHLLDPLGIVMVGHECRGAQYLTLRGTQGTQKIPGHSKAYCKMFYKATFISNRRHTASFDINNFKADEAPDYYLCMCFEGPMMWAIPNAELCKIWSRLRRSEYGTMVSGLYINDEQQNRELGGLHALLDDKSEWLLTSPKQLGL